MAALLALPPPSSLPASTTTGRAKALLASEAPPVAAIRRVPDEDRRRQLQQAAEQAQATVDDGAGTGATSVKNRSGRPAAGGFQSESAGAATTAQERPRVDLQTRNAGPSSAFVAQSLYQESMGSGLHIEPWAQAISAYQRADSAGTQTWRSSLSL
jgi:hypothetical protein